MAKKDDPSYYESGFERISKDRYWTHPWLTSALLNTVEVPDVIWEPSAGRGDMASILLDYGKGVVASDIDLSEFDFGLCEAHEMNFLESFPPREDVKAIITNPPYNQPRGVADQFVRHAVSLMCVSDVEFVAMLLRAEFSRGKRRRDVFGECPQYYGELVLTTRPRWDWWFREEPEASPRHNFSWFIWKRDHEGPSHQFFHYKDKKKS